MGAVDATFTAEGSAIEAGAIETTYGATIDLEFTSTTNSHIRRFELISTSDSDNVALPSDLAHAGSPTGKTATFTFPSDPGTGYGASVLVRGYQEDADGPSKGQTSEKYAIVGVPGPSGIVPFSAGEMLYRYTIDGWMRDLNRGLGGSALGRALYDEDGDIILYAEDSPTALPSSPTTTIWNSINGLTLVNHGGAIVQFPGVIESIAGSDRGMWPYLGKYFTSSATGWLEWDIGKGEVLPYHGTSPSDEYVMAYQFTALSKVAEMTGTGMVYRCGKINVRGGNPEVSQADLPLTSADQLNANADDIEVIVDGSTGWTFRVDVKESYTTDWLYVVSGIALYAP